MKDLNDLIAVWIWMVFAGIGAFIGQFLLVPIEFALVLGTIWFIVSHLRVI
jgi:hypothetical protein